MLKTPDYYETGYKVYIGPKRYFVTSDVGDGRIQWYAFFSLPPGTKRAPSGWGGSQRDEQADPEEDLVQYIKSLHEGWSDEVHHVLDNTPKESVEQRDLYDRRPEIFRTWTDGNVALMGDAVHPMMPNLGQGGCQAIEDAFVLTEALKSVNDTAALPAVSRDKHSLGNSLLVAEHALLREHASRCHVCALLTRACAYAQHCEPPFNPRQALKEYYNKRIVRATAVQFLSRLASDLIINAFDTPWSPHDNKGTNWKSYLTFFWKPILQYVLLPLRMRCLRAGTCAVVFFTFCALGLFILHGVSLPGTLSSLCSSHTCTVTTPQVPWESSPSSWQAPGGLGTGYVRAQYLNLLLPVVAPLCVSVVDVVQRGRGGEEALPATT